MKIEKQEDDISLMSRKTYSSSQLTNKRGRSPEHRTFLKKETTKAQDQKKPKCYKQTKSQIDVLSENEEAKIKSAVMERATEVQSKLSPEFPSMVKYMLKSHVTRGFWLALPSGFCHSYLPVEDTTMILEDEKGDEFESKYLALKVGLSAGWRGFSISHKIMEGDAVIFQLVKLNKFKVYIVRSNGSVELDGALGLLNLNGSAQMHIDEGEKHQNNTSFKAKTEERCSQEAPALGSFPMERSVDHSENDSDDHGSDILDGIMLAKSVADFKEVRSIEEFNIYANGLIITSQLSKHLQAKYYELCTSRKEYLHDHLLEGLNCQLVAGIIAEAINIADATRAAKLATPHANLVTWLETLKSFQGLGMSVGFIVERLEQLMKLSSKRVRYEEGRVEQMKAEKEKRMLEVKIAQVNEKLKKIDLEMKSLDLPSDGGGLEQVFREVASRPW